MGTGNVVRKNGEKGMTRQKKLLIGSIAGVAAGILFLGAMGIFLFRIDAVKAREIALKQTGGGEIVSQEVESEGLLNEYKYKILNGENYYEVEIGGFGNIKEMEQGTGYPR